MPWSLSASDFKSLNDLAGATLTITKADGGEDAELAQEVEGLYLALQRLEAEISKSEFLVTNPESNYALELKTIWKGCRKVLVKIGNEDVVDSQRIRTRLCQHTSAVLLCLNLIKAGSPGRIARRINFQGKDMSKMRQSLNQIVAQLTSQSDGSSLTTASEEDAAIWGELERKLTRKGHPMMVVRENKKILLDYVKELGDRGMLDDSVIARDMSTESSPEFAGMSTPGRWFSNVDLPCSPTRWTRSCSNLPLRDCYDSFEGFETPEPVSDQSDYYSEAGSDDTESDGTSVMSDKSVAKYKRISEDVQNLRHQASIIEIKNVDKASVVEIQVVERDAKDVVPPPLPPRSPLRPISLKPTIVNSTPISPLDIGFPRDSLGFHQSTAFALPEEGYEPPSRSRLANAKSLAAEEQNLYRKFQAEDEEQKATTPSSQETQRVKFKTKRSFTTEDQLAVRNLEALENQSVAARRRANSALARLLESEEGHNFRKRRLESMLEMKPLLDRESSLKISSSLEAEKAALEAVAKAAKAERKEIRKQKMKWLLEVDHMRLAHPLGGESLFERTIGVTDIFETFGGGPVYRFCIHPSWRRFFGSGKGGRSGAR